jgi:hypothetical protein
MRFGDQPGLSFGVDPVPLPSERARKSGEDRELAGESLGRSDADFGAGERYGPRRLLCATG